MPQSMKKLQTEKTKIMKRIVGIDIKVKGVSNELHKLDERLKAINKKLAAKKRRHETRSGGRRTKSTFKKRNQRERKYRTKKFHKKRGTRILRKK